MKTLTLIFILILAGAAQAQTLTATVSPQHVVRIVTTNTISIQFNNNGPKPPTTKDFITLVADGVVPVSGRISNWQYLGGGSSAPSSPVTTGVLTFTVPVAGKYQAYLFRNGSAVLDRVAVANLTVELTSIETSGVTTTVTRSKSLADEIVWSFSGAVGTLVAPPGADIVTSGLPAPGVQGVQP